MVFAIVNIINDPNRLLELEWANSASTKEWWYFSMLIRRPLSKYGTSDTWRAMTTSFSAKIKRKSWKLWEIPNKYFVQCSQEPRKKNTGKTIGAGLRLWGEMGRKGTRNKLSVLWRESTKFAIGAADNYGVWGTKTYKKEAICGTLSPLNRLSQESVQRWIG